MKTLARLIQAVLLAIMLIFTWNAVAYFANSADSDDSTPAVRPIPTRQSILQSPLTLDGLKTSGRYADGYVVLDFYDSYRLENYLNKYDYSETHQPYDAGSRYGMYFSDVFYLVPGDNLKIVIYSDVPLGQDLDCEITEYTNYGPVGMTPAYNVERYENGYRAVLSCHATESGTYQFKLWHQDKTAFKRCSIVFYFE
ncbi:hypothetical protein [Dehalococcoides mccartyi]|uniref:hypothetical protein n=1 Tax=Dehalococcoides mccartyi TaxID=61435 RepID=UPI0002B76D36|nr:hypothetical protein [Dehalococcoides mccartyi]AGG05897.1 hypothetical protein dcmb_266 [Dehalococcoides mccartyi DCMB5]